MPTVLVADDSLSVRKVAERLLKEAGLEVALAANGEEAMHWMSSQRPDLVIADVIMPDKSGFEVCAFVRAQANLANTPVLLVSGFVDDEVTRQAEACRADGVIKKPFQGASLRERVLQLLAERKEQAAPAPAAAIEQAIEMPAAAPELEVPLPAAALSPAPVPPAVAAPVEAGPQTTQLVEQIRRLQETIEELERRATEQEKRSAHLESQLLDFRESTTQALKDLSGGGQSDALQTRLAEQETRSVQLEQQIQTFRENAAQAIAQAQDLHARLAEEERQSEELRRRLAEIEPAAASAKQLLQTLAEFARQALTPGQSKEQ